MIPTPFDRSSPRPRWRRPGWRVWLALAVMAIPSSATPPPATTPAQAALEARLDGLDRHARRPLLRAAVLDGRLDPDARGWALRTAVADLAADGRSPAVLLEWAQAADRSMRRDLERAYWRTLVTRAEDKPAANAYLFEALRGRSPSTGSSVVRRWAARALCARGADWAWEEIRTVFDPRVIDDAVAIAVCEKQIAALTACDEPVRGLIELLRRPDALPEQPVHRWAIDALAALDTPAGRSFLIAYGLRIQHADWRHSRTVAAALRKHGMNDAALRHAGFLPNPPSLHHRLHPHGQP